MLVTRQCQWLPGWWMSDGGCAGGKSMFQLTEIGASIKH